MYFQFLNKIFVWIDIGVYCIIPFVTMCICSTMIIMRIKSKSRTMLLKMRTSSMNRHQRYKRIKRNRQLAGMLLLTNIYFIISSLPYCIMFVLHRGKESENPLGQLTVHVMSYTNNAFNFFLYGISSQKYRKEFWILLSKCFRKKQLNRRHLKIFNDSLEKN